MKKTNNICHPAQGQGPLMRDLTAKAVFGVRSQLCNASRFVWDDKSEMLS